MKRLAILCLILTIMLFITTVAFASIDDYLAKIKSTYESGNTDEFKEAIFALYDNYIGKGKTKLVETPIKPIKNWSGDGIKNTEPFTITSTPWKLRWNNKGALLQAMLYNPKSGDFLDIVVNTSNKGIGETYIYKSGTFYLGISAIGAWEIEIEE